MNAAVEAGKIKLVAPVAFFLTLLEVKLRINYRLLNKMSSAVCLRGLKVPLCLGASLSFSRHTLLQKTAWRRSLSTPLTSLCVLAPTAPCYFDTWLNITVAESNSSCELVPPSCRRCVFILSESSVRRGDANSSAALISARTQVEKCRTHDLT